MQTRLETFISVVLFLDKMDEAVLEEHLHSIQKYLVSKYSNYEVILVQTDTNISDLRRKQILENIPAVRWLKVALLLDDLDILLKIGLESAIGDYVIFFKMKGEGRYSEVNIIEEMVNKCSGSCDIVIGRSDQQLATAAYKFARGLASKAFGIINYKLPKNTTSLFCFSRKVVNNILSTRQSNNRFFMNAILDIYNTKSHTYKTSDSETNRKTLYSGIRKFLKFAILNSTNSFRLISSLGILGSLFSMLFASYSILVHFFKNDVVEGWTTFVFFVSTLFLVLFVLLAFLGEYMKFILMEVRRVNPSYVTDEYVSSVRIVNKHKLNVSKRVACEAK